MVHHFLPFAIAPCKFGFLIVLLESSFLGPHKMSYLKIDEKRSFRFANLFFEEFCPPRNQLGFSKWNSGQGYDHFSFPSGALIF
ncbi:hypothetical protein DLM78_19915 [Leptospira stimsonii]|uniref:Uncharacterized protein n=1 Tax=Leptospira stimsonii TaxID=2202203 RepID=A0A8B3CJP6_9LEPT|nr:hypothetical protein DLM78_19915 [Leptospira stimsonii]